MKSKLRNITINDLDFSYWYRWSNYLTVFISPKSNKTCKITLLFQADEPKEPTQHCWRFYAVNAIKNGVDHHLCVTKPRFIAQVINHLFAHLATFDPVNRTVTYSAWELLSDMGYTSVIPDWIQEL